MATYWVLYRTKKINFVSLANNFYVTVKSLNVVTVPRRHQCLLILNYYTVNKALIYLQLILRILHILPAISLLQGF